MPQAHTCGSCTQAEGRLLDEAALACSSTYSLAAVAVHDTGASPSVFL